MKTSETASSILEFAATAHLGSREVVLRRTVNGIAGPVTSEKVLPVADVTAMAKLWLMLPEILDQLESGAQAHLQEGFDKSAAEIESVINRLKALEG